MKRLLALILILALLLPGCATSGPREPITFYYPRIQYQYGSADGVIARESRESAGHAGELSYLLNLYLMGPADEALRSPLPQGILLLSAGIEEDCVILTLSDTSRLLSESDFALASACLALTSMEITGLNTVTIKSADRSLTITPEDLILYDDSATTAATEETQ